MRRFALIALTLVACHKTPPEIVLTETPLERPAPAPVEAPPVAPEDLALASVYFDFDRYDLRSDAIAALDRNYDVLTRNPDLGVRIEGHCDERGTTEYNLALGERRANAAARYLTARGISPSRITTVSYGEERPADTGHHEAAWARNRRAELQVVEAPRAVSQRE